MMRSGGCWACRHGSGEEAADSSLSALGTTGGTSPESGRPTSLHRRPLVQATHQTTSFLDGREKIHQSRQTTDRDRKSDSSKKARQAEAAFVTGRLHQRVQFQTG
eukprot:4719372-Pleurochrysis_carterae.AAC.2